MPDLLNTSLTGMLAFQRALDLTGHNKSASARILGISRPTLTRKIRKYGLARSEAESG